MEKNIALLNQRRMKMEQKSFGTIVTNSEFAMCMSKIFSAIMEENITPAQALAILNTMFGMLILVFPVEMPFIGRIISLVWVCVSLIQCRLKGLK